MTTINITAPADRDNLEPLFDLANTIGLTFSNFSYDDCDDINFDITFPSDFDFSTLPALLASHQLDELADYLN